MRDPWFPALLLVIMLFGVWLGIIGPLPDGFINGLQRWQTLAGAAVAVGAAFIAFRNTSRSLVHAEALETHRRQRKHAALRAMLPLALSQIATYAEQTVQALQELITRCSGETLPPNTFSAILLKPVPSDTLKSLADFIEYSDAVNIDVLASTVALIQIHDSRLRSMYRDNNDPSASTVVVRSNLESSIIDGATIYAGAVSGFAYARRIESQLPSELLWEAITRALRNMRFWDDQYPRLHDVVTARETRSRGPFEALAPQNNRTAS